MRFSWIPFTTMCAGRTLRISIFGAICLGFTVHTSTRPSTKRPNPGDIYVANLSGNNITYYDGATGSFKGQFVPTGAAGLEGATGLAFGPQGDLYVSSSAKHQVLRFNGDDGSFRNVVVNAGELAQPFSLAFGPDGDLFVSSGSDAHVLRYERETGSLVGIAAAGEGLLTPIGMDFDDEGMLWVANAGGNTIRVYDPDTAELIEEFAHPDLLFPSDVKLGGDGWIYVSNALAYSLVRFDRDRPGTLEILATLPDNGVPVGIDFRTPDSLYVGDFTNSRLYVFTVTDARLHLVSHEGMAGPENIAVRP